MVSGIILLIFILLVFSIITVAANSKNIEKGITAKNESFEKVIRTLYFYLILIILICILIFGTIEFFSSLMDIYLPEKIKQTVMETEITKNNNIQKFITSLSSILISFPMFIYYSKKTKKEK